MQEYEVTYGNKERTGMRDFYNEPQTLHFKIYAEGDIKEKAVKNNLSQKLSVEEKNDLLNHKNLYEETNSYWKT